MFKKIIEITELIEEDRHVQVLTMFTDLWPRFSTAPASTKYHGSYNGGLLDHTIQVVKASRYLYNFYLDQKKLKTTLESVTFCALVHDIGKIGTKLFNSYVPETPESLKFTYNKECPQIDHELLTLFWLNHYRVQLSEEEMAAVYYHAGPYVDAYKKTAETDLLMILHTADNLSAKILNI